MHAPESFNVGRGGRSLPIKDRQAISVARGFLGDPDVLMLHKPFAVMQDESILQLCEIIKAFVSKGGLWGVLSGKLCPHGLSATDYLKGCGTRTVLFNTASNELPHMLKGIQGTFIDRTVAFDASWDRERTDHLREEQLAQMQSRGSFSRKLKASLRKSFQVQIDSLRESVSTPSSPLRRGPPCSAPLPRSVSEEDVPRGNLSGAEDCGAVGFEPRMGQKGLQRGISI